VAPDRAKVGLGRAGGRHLDDARERRHTRDRRDARAPADARAHDDVAGP
jgi:hypothetical protein